jgi:hypothetical protein
VTAADTTAQPAHLATLAPAIGLRAHTVLDEVELGARVAESFAHASTS